MVAITHPDSFPMVRLRPAPALVYRRRRLALAGALLVVLALALALSTGLRAGGADARPVARVGVVVGPGDTVWSLASELAPNRDPRPVVDAIVEANGGSSLVAGQRLELVLP